MNITAEELLNKLINKESVEVNQHFLDFDGEVTWYSNPYGVDGCLGNTPTIEMCVSFLNNTNNDVVYGLTPS